jgi:hypothetical protein
MASAEMAWGSEILCEEDDGWWEEVLVEEYSSEKVLALVKALVSETV